MIEETTAQVGGTTDIVAVVFLGIIVVALLTLAIYMIRIYRIRYIRNTVRFNIIMPDGKILKQRVKDIDNINKIENIRYLFDPKAVINYKNTKEIFYFYNVPEPITFSKKGFNKNTDLSGKDIANIIDEEYSHKLFKEKSAQRQEVLLYIIIGAIVILAGYMYMNFDNGVLIQDVSANKDLIQEWVKASFGGV